MLKSIITFEEECEEIENSLEIEPHILYSIIERKDHQNNKYKKSIRNINIKYKYMKEIYQFIKSIIDSNNKEQMETGLSIINESLNTMIDEFSLEYELKKGKRKLKKR